MAETVKHANLVAKLNEKVQKLELDNETLKKDLKT
jgi:hypothetical protein